MKIIGPGLSLEDGGLKRIALLGSFVFHAALALAILCFGSLAIQRPREAPRSIDLVSIQELLPPPVKPPEIPRAEAPLVEAPSPKEAPRPAAAAAVPAAVPAPATNSSPALPENLSPASAASGGMTAPTGPGGAGGGTAGPAAEPDYLPQYKITDVPVIPVKDVLAKIQYPPLAAKQGIEATVYLELLIDDTGKIRKITVLKDPGYGFADAAVSALSDMTCVPAKMNGQTVAVRFRYPVRFTLK